MVVISSNFNAPVEGILYQAPATKLIINEQDLGTATLYVTEHNVIWGGGSSGGITLLYPTICVHAIQKNPCPALYVVLTYELRLPELAQDTNPDEDDDEEDIFEGEPHTQLRFVPQNEGDLQGLYSAMSHGQTLHPDPADEVDDDDYMDGEEFDGDDGEEEFEDAEESNASPEEAAARLRQLRIENTNGTHIDDDEEEVGEE